MRKCNTPTKQCCIRADGSSTKILKLRVCEGEWYNEWGEELAVPIEGSWNNHMVIRFAEHGKVFRVNKTDMTRTELRVVNGEWSALCSDGEWASVWRHDDIDAGY
ncbi:MAG: hypothetical protein JWN51_3508 [Phycisphaerales bacterium]|nr:hypothetical protein [Phycisphaerales bacterium]